MIALALSILCAVVFGHIMKWATHARANLLWVAAVNYAGASMAPPIKYARSGELHIAYWEYGDGPIDLLWVPTWIWESEFVWEEPYTAKMFERLGSFVELEMVVDENRLDDARTLVASLASDLGLSLGERRSYLELLLAGK